MSDQTPTPSPTQVVYPWKATLRTALAYIVGAGIVLPIVFGIFQDQLGAYISAEWMARIGWVVGLIVAVSLAVTRIIAIPQVNAWLTTIGLGATPKTDA